MRYVEIGVKWALSCRLGNCDLFGGPVARRMKKIEYGIVTSALFTRQTRQASIGSDEQNQLSVGQAVGPKSPKNCLYWTNVTMPVEVLAIFSQRGGRRRDRARQEGVTAGTPRITVWGRE
jgi:hypothetical protein